jgi:hypothetical protein
MSDPERDGFAAFLRETEQKGVAAAKQREAEEKRARELALEHDTDRCFARAIGIVEGRVKPRPASRRRRRRR